MEVETPQMDALASRYRVSARTIYRWHKARVNIGDPVEVAQHLARIPHPSPAALEAVTAELENELSKP